MRILRNRVIVTLSGLLAPSRVFAEELTTVEGAATLKSLEVLFANVVNVITSLSVVALFLMFVTSGFSFLFSGGDPKKLEQARGTFANAIIGLIIMVSAYLIIRIISVFTGVEQILQFEIPSLE